MESEYGIQMNNEALNELVYADDTLLLGSSIDHLQKYMQCVAAMGAEYGLVLNWKKIEQMNIQCDHGQLMDDMGNNIGIKSSI
eukprot:6985698-Karenia_brevis.AAC.1